MTQKNNMNTNTNTIIQSESIKGLLDIGLKHTITSTEVSCMEFFCEPFPKSEWDKAVSFLKKTYDRTSSESQLRFFYQPSTGTWRAWAFPQKARTGLSAEELPDDPKTKIQLAMFPGYSKDNPGGWLLYGTIHSHGKIGAFQSGTDEANEKCQDGLHVTIGKMDEPRFDIHYRFYHKGYKLVVPLSAFFKLNDQATTALNLLPKRFREEAENEMILNDLSIPNPVEYPKEWDDNVIEVVNRSVGFQQEFHRGCYAGTTTYNPNYNGAPYKYVAERADKCLKEIISDPEVIAYFHEHRESLAVDDVEEMVEVFIEDPLFKSIFESVREKYLDYDDIKQAIDRLIPGTDTKTDYEIEQEYMKYLCD